MINILFVCLGNICRSPTVQGVFETLVASEGLSAAIGADSAGTSAYHLGQAPDPRAVEAAARRGIDISYMRARRVEAADFHAFDLVLAMDRGNCDAMEAIVPADRKARLAMFLSFAPEVGIEDVPDPYFGGGGGFERVLDIAEAGSRGLLERLRAEYPERLIAATPQGRDGGRG